MSRFHDRTPTEPSWLENPISLVEEYCIDQDWQVERPNDNELWGEILGNWGGYRLWVIFHEDTEFLQFNAYLNLKIPTRFTNTVAQTITLINERIWIGHFEIWGEESTPVFRLVMPMRGAELSDEQVDDIFASLYQECERFYPCFQWVIWGGKSPADAIAAAMVDTEGEA
ncbi:YbjN domain-containing protein [Magnetofaba australis]|uniref:YbjN domain-containing protein n=1 Tax=Magnetofaba australis IT-1 TaxID=1434232 RepID=A0A1Y2K5U1_9PROT|nr:YbjN domain-containing protein [Magnetofaba australis]OSM05054.1 hypothetical protein MAIT1_03188 [Magnetofaba australis IT-1]